MIETLQENWQPLKQKDVLTSGYDWNPAAQVLNELNVKWLKC